MTLIYGARLTDHTPPNGTVYVRAGAPLDAPGTLAAPMGDPQRALRTAPLGGTVVGAGEFPVSLHQEWRKPVTIQPYPGERLRLTGSEPVPTNRWTQHPDTGYWSTIGPIFDHTPNTTDSTFLDPARPWACWPEQLWCDDEPMVMVAPGSAIGPGEFTVEAGGRHVINMDPAVHQIRMAVRSTAFTGALDMQTGQHPPVTMLGVDVWEYATTSRDRAAVKLYGPSVAQDVTVVECSAIGLSMMRSAGAVMEHVTAAGCGQLGLHGYLADDLDLGWCLLEGNNRKGFAWIGEAGAAKWATSLRVNAHHNMLIHNNGHGLWSDLESHDSQWWRNDVFHGRTGIFCENTRGGRIVGNRVRYCDVFGILISDSSQATVTHNTVTGSGQQDIRVQTGHRHPEWSADDHTVTGNVTSAGPDPAVPPSFAAATLLELPPVEAAAPYTGWYGPVYTPPEESPMPYDVQPLEQSVGDLSAHVAAAIAEIRRLERVIADDAHLATIEDLATRLWSTAVLLNQANDTVASQQGNISALTGMIASRDVTITEVTAERDTAEAANEEAQELLAEATQTIALHEQTIAAANATISGQADQLTGQAAEITALQAEVDRLALELAECEATNPPDLDPVIVGGSHKNGWQALKAMTAPQVPMAYRKYVAQPRISTADMATITGVIADGAVPFISPTRSTPASGGAPSPDTVFNVDALLTAGHGDKRGVYTLMHEPTQRGVTPGEYRAMLEADMPYLRERLPMWWRVPCFMAFDFADDTAARHPMNGWLPTDLGLIDGLGVDVYDKGNADGNGDGKWLVDLVDQVTPVAFELGLQVWIMETSAPDTGQKGRRAGWKPDWLFDAWSYVENERLPDGRRMFRSLLTFNSDVGPDAPPAVTGPPAVKAGWWFDTTPEAQAMFRDVIFEAQGT